MFRLTYENAGSYSRVFPVYSNAHHINNDSIIFITIGHNLQPFFGNGGKYKIVCSTLRTSRLVCGERDWVIKVFQWKLQHHKI